MLIQTKVIVDGHGDAKDRVKEDLGLRHYANVPIPGFEFSHDGTSYQVSAIDFGKERPTVVYRGKGGATNDEPAQPPIIYVKEILVAAPRS